MTKLKRLFAYSFIFSGIAASAHAQFPSPIEVIDADGNLTQLPAAQYIIQYKHSKKTNMTSKISKMNGEVVRYIDDMNIVAAVIPKSEIERIKQDPDVQFIEPDYPRYLMAEEVPYGIPMVQADQVSDSNAANQKVCVIDTGYDIAHIDLPSANVTGDDFGAATGPWNTDGDAHGTHVAGTIAAVGGNDEGVVGVLPGNNLPLHIVKIFDDNGNWTSSSNLITALNSCVNAGATVVNMSLGGPSFSTSENNAFNDAYNNGVISVAAAGNDGDASLSYPASYDNVISVGAVNSSKVIGGYSQFNYQVELSAPGSSVKSTTPGNNYSNFTGTSMASPHVAGVAALVWSQFPDCTQQQIRNTLAATAEDRGNPGRDDFYGLGIVQAKAAVDMLAQGCDTAPELEIPGPPEQPTFDPELDNGELIDDMLASSGQFFRFYIDVPEGATNLNIVTTGDNGDADLYVSANAEPTRTSFDCRSWSSSSNETCTFETPDATRYHIYVYAFSTFQNVDLVATYEEAPVVNQDPVAKFNVSCDGLTCTFDASESSDADGEIVKYYWSPEPGQPPYNGVSITHTYTQEGVFFPGLSVFDDDGARGTTRGRVEVIDPNNLPNNPPVADFSVSCDGLTCTFDASSSTDSDGEIVKYFWSPEPGQPGLGGVTVTHTYTQAGVFFPGLSVFDDDGDRGTARGRVEVEDPNAAPNQAPVASFTVTCDGLTCTFDASASSDSDGSIDRYYWKPEAGQPAYGGVTATHTYTAPGVHFPGLSVFDDDGARGTSRGRVEVSE